jgi:hypothetical protein
MALTMIKASSVITGFRGGRIKAGENGAYYQELAGLLQISKRWYRSVSVIVILSYKLAAHRFSSMALRHCD